MSPLLSPPCPHCPHSLGLLLLSLRDCRTLNSHHPGWIPGNSYLGVIARSITISDQPATIAPDAKDGLGLEAELDEQGIEPIGAKRDGVPGFTARPPSCPSAWRNLGVAVTVDLVTVPEGVLVPARPTHDMSQGACRTVGFGCLSGQVVPQHV